MAAVLLQRAVRHAGAAAGLARGLASVPAAGTPPAPRPGKLTIFDTTLRDGEQSPG
jgi:hypothetical protein